MRLLVIASVISALMPSFAQAAAINITIDENGNGFYNGTPLHSYLSNDPGAGGMNRVLTYDLPFLGTTGDVLFTINPEVGNVMAATLYVSTATVR